MSSLAFSAPSSQAVFTLEELHSEAVSLSIPPSRPNIRRVRRAIEIARTGSAVFVKHDDRGRIWSVPSQSSDEVYEVVIPSVDLVLSPSEFRCSCHDSAVKQNVCKHAMAVAMLERAPHFCVESHCDCRHLVDRSISHLLPDSYERLLLAAI